MTGVTQTQLLIEATDVIKRSILNSDIDSDWILPSIYNVQITRIKPILTKTLYDKIVSDYENDTLSGVYLTIYQDFILDMLSYFAAAEFISTSAYKVTDGGINRLIPEFGELADITEISRLVEHYKSLASATELIFLDWIKDNPVSEYTKTNAENTSLGWYFPQ